jgi:outer membrane protein assembly factor BamA
MLLGDNRGLRGYKRNRFDGDGILLLNGELRLVFLATKYAVIGGALFADAGYIWEGPMPDLNLFSPRRGVGCGIRVGLPILNGLPIYRLDLGYPLDAEAGDPDWTVSFGMGQFF